MTTNTTDAKPHLDFNDPKYASAAAYILDRHNHNEPEANITSAVRDFLVLTNLSQAEEIKEENPPSDSSRRAVDLTAHDTFVEMKRRVGTTGGNSPNPDYIQQLDDYLFQSQTMGKGVRMGVLTDGKHWLLRWSNAGPVKITYPYAFTLESSEQWLGLYEWLRDKALVSQVDILPTRNTIVEHFGAGSLPYQRDIASLKALYLAYAALALLRQRFLTSFRRFPGRIATCHSTSRPKFSSRLWTPWYPASHHTCVSPPCNRPLCLRYVMHIGRCGAQAVHYSRIHPNQCHCPFFVWCISGSRSPDRFLVDDGASMMLASTMPSLSRSPCDSRWALISSNSPLPSSWRSRRWRKLSGQGFRQAQADEANSRCAPPVSARAACGTPTPTMKPLAQDRPG